MVYHSVTVPFSQYRISNSNTDIDDFFNTGELKKKNRNKANKCVFANYTASGIFNVLK